MSNQQQWGHYQQPYGPPPGYPQPPQGYGPSPYNPPPKKSHGCLIAGIVGFVVLVFGFGGCLAFCGAAAKNAQDKQVKEERDWDDGPAKDVTPEDMIAAYEKNEVAGDEKYKDKKLEIRGSVKSIDSAIGDAPVVRLSGGLLKTVMLFDIPKADAAKLEKGQRIAAVCKGGGEVMGSPVLRKCKLLAK